MNINFKATNIVLTEAIRSYVTKRIEALGKFIGKEKDDVVIDVEVSQTTKHHKSGNIFRTEITIRNAGRRLRAVSTKDDLYTSIDDAREELERQLTTGKDRKDTLVRRGARSVKKMLKGLSKRNPFTSKY